MNTLTLPQNYQILRTVDLQKDKKTAILVNGLAVVLSLFFFVLGFFFSDSFSLTVRRGSLFAMGAKLFFLLVGMVAYFILHELVHGVCIRLFSGVRPQYGFTGLYAFAGSDKAYFDKKSYLVISLAPVVLWGIVLAAACMLVPSSFFWPVYLIQIVNLSGAAGDLYVTGLLVRAPKEILIQDVGVAMTVYAPVK